MRILPTRGSILTGTAILGALVWGLMECLALQWSALAARFRLRGPLRPT